MTAILLWLADIIRLRDIPKAWVAELELRRMEREGDDNE